MTHRYDDVRKFVSVLLAMRETFDHHGEGVAALMKKMAIALRMDESTAYLMEVGGYLHDVGKIFIDADLLNQARVLSEEERSDLQRHTTLGWALMEQVGYDPMLLDIVRYHHEDYDGEGYPDGLSGEKIPEAARITKICDVFESLTHARIYRPAFNREFALNYLEQGRGKMFDPRLLDVFFKVIHE